MWSVETDENLPFYKTQLIVRCRGNLAKSTSLSEIVSIFTNFKGKVSQQIIENSQFPNIRIILSNSTKCTRYLNQ